MVNKFKFKINYYSPCNAYFTRAHGGEVGTASFTEEQLARFAEYCKHILAQQTEDRASVVNMYSDDMVGQLSDVATVMAPMGSDGVSCFFMLDSVTLYDHREALLELLAKASGFHYAPSVRATLLESEDLFDTPNSESYNIRWAAAKGLCNYIDVSLTPSNIHRVVEMFDRFKKLRSIYPNVKCELSIDVTSPESADFDEAAIRNALSIVKMYFDTIDPELAEFFVYRPVPALRGVRTGNALMADLMVDMCEGGELYCGYDVVLMTDKARDAFVLGNIKEDFAVLDARLETLRTQLSESGNGFTGDCYDMTRAVPWVDPDHEFSMVPAEQHCIMHELLAEYLPYRLKKHNDDKFGTQ